MSCFPCFGKKKKEDEEESSSNEGSRHAINVPKNPDAFKVKNSDSPAPSGNIQAQSFTFRELATATKNFTPDSLLGEGGLGRVYKGSLENGQTVAVKQLGRNSLQGSREFLVEVLMLSLLHHPNLVNLVGYCADGDQRLLVYEFMPRGSLEDHLFDLKPDQKPLDWYTRMKIAFGAGQGLEYLHDKANPPVIYRDLKTSNILLDDFMVPRLSDFGLAKLGPMGDRPVIASSVMGTYGYCAPEYSRNGQLTLKSDVYSFGVILLELITGRRALDTSKPTNEQNLVAWAQPMFHDQKKYPELADPNLEGNYPLKGLNQAVAVAAMCIQDEASVRPLVADIVMTLSFLIEPTPTPQAIPTPTPDRTPQAQESSHHSKSSDSDSSGEHVVETLQLGLTSHQNRGSKPGSRSSSKRSSRQGSVSSSGSDVSSSSKHSKRSLSSSSKHSKKSLNSSSKQGKESLNSSSKHHEDLSSDGSDRSSCSKHSEGSSKFGSSKFLSMKHSRGSYKHGSRSSGSYDGSDDGSDSRHSEKSEDNEYESD